MLPQRRRLELAGSPRGGGGPRAGLGRGAAERGQLPARPRPQHPAAGAAAGSTAAAAAEGGQARAGAAGELQPASPPRGAARFSARGKGQGWLGGLLPRARPPGRRGLSAARAGGAAGRPLAARLWRASPAPAARAALAASALAPASAAALAQGPPLLLPPSPPLLPGGAAASRALPWKVRGQARSSQSAASKSEGLAGLPAGQAVRSRAMARPLVSFACRAACLKEQLAKKARFWRRLLLAGEGSGASWRGRPPEPQQQRGRRQGRLGWLRGCAKGAGKGRSRPSTPAALLRQARLPPRQGAARAAQPRAARAWPGVERLLPG